VKIDPNEPLTMNKIHKQTNSPEVKDSKEAESSRKVRPEKRKQAARPKLSIGEKKIPEELKEAVTQLNDTSEAMDLGVRFRLHEETERYIVQIVDRRENKIVKEIPPERLLNLVGQIQEMIGLLLDEKR